MKCSVCGTQTLTVADPGTTCRQCVLEKRLTSRTKPRRPAGGENR